MDSLGRKCGIIWSFDFVFFKLSESIRSRNMDVTKITSAHDNMLYFVPNTQICLETYTVYKSVIALWRYVWIQRKINNWKWKKFLTTLLETYRHEKRHWVKKTRFYDGWNISVLIFNLLPVIVYDSPLLWLRSEMESGSLEFTSRHRAKCTVSALIQCPF